MKTHAPTPGRSFRTPGRLGWLLLIPLLGLTLPALATGPEINIESTGDTNAHLSWQDPAWEYIVVSSPTPDGPWTPCLEAIDRGTNLCQMALCTTDECRYFRLARGYRFEDDFEDGDLDGWTIAYNDPQLASQIHFDADGRLRIYGTCSTCTDLRVSFGNVDWMMADFAISIDILGWDDSEGHLPNVALIGRGHPAIFDDPPNYQCYVGGVSMAREVPPTNSWLFVIKVWPDGSLYLDNSDPFERITPAKDYRLVFSGVGGNGILQLYDLADRTLIKQHEILDQSPFTDGGFGFRVTEYGPNKTMDFTLDNFVAVGTTP